MWALVAGLHENQVECEHHYLHVDAQLHRHFLCAVHGPGTACKTPMAICPKAPSL